MCACWLRAIFSFIFPTSSHPYMISKAKSEGSRPASPRPVKYTRPYSHSILFTLYFLHSRSRRENALPEKTPLSNALCPPPPAQTYTFASRVCHCYSLLSIFTTLEVSHEEMSPLKTEGPKGIKQLDPYPGMLQHAG